MLDDLYDMSQIIKIYSSILIRNIFSGVGAVLKNIRALSRKKFINLLIISKILHQYLLNVSKYMSVIYFRTLTISLILMTRF